MPENQSAQDRPLDDSSLKGGIDVSSGIPGIEGNGISKSDPHDIAEPALDDLMSNDSMAGKIKVKEFEQLMQSAQSQQHHGIDLLLDVTLPISIELGRTAMSISDILGLGPGSVVELEKLAGEPVDLLVNNKLIARGEVVVVDENFGIRITSMISPQDRIKSLK
jgi:flagellar motor switch protein FliN/FliY